MAEQKHSEACCNIPPIEAEGYKPKGKYEEIGGFKTYVTGSPTATKAILFIYDIFGYFPQTIQGADILSVSGPASQYQVFMPDFFLGPAADISWFPPQTEEHKTSLGKFFANQAAPPKTLAKIPGLLVDIEKAYPNITEWGVIGFCWGGKIVSLITSAEGEVKFKVAAECHPAFVDAKDAEKIKVPIAILASKDENIDDVKAFEAALKVDNHVVTFDKDLHGWMAARSDLSDEAQRKSYERGYKTVLEFFAKHL